MNKILICFLLIFGTQNSYSQEIELLCKGISSGTDVRTDNYEFPMTVNFTTQYFHGIPMPLIPSCWEYGEKITAILPVCTVNSNEMTCTCSNSARSKMSSASNFNLSRVTGKLTINTYFKNNNSWKGDYFCEKITARKF